ncbi:hypothetical protein ACFOEZ_11810 [Tianweitania populi]|nr:hypothetical protein [Tianweitania populi]
MKHTLAVALILVPATISIPAQAESPDRVDPLLDCSTPVLDADTPEKAKLLRVQYGGDALVRELRETYAARLAGLFWDQKEGEHSRMVLRLTGDEPVEDRKSEVCGEPLTVAFVTGQTHTREELQKLHVDNLNWLRGKFPGLQGTYADERTGQIVLEIYQPEAEEIDLEALRQEAESRLDAPLRVEMTTAKVVVGPGLRAPVQ